MKIIKSLVLITALAIGFVSCKKDKPTDDDSVIKSRIIGTWTLQKTETNDYKNDTLKYSNTETETSVNTIEFKADGTCATLGEDIDSGSYIITNSGKSLILIFSETMTYEIRGILPNDLVLYRENIETTEGITRKFTSLLSFRR